MEKKIFEMCGLGVRLLLRCWTGNEKIWGDNLLDIVEFGQSCGLNYIDRNKFNMTIESFTCDMAEDFMKNMAETVSSIERKDALLLQIQSDIKNVAISEEKILKSNLKAEELSKLIEMNSEKERKTWSEKENGVYRNCVRYITQGIAEFMTKLPSYVPEALKIIIQRQEEYLTLLHQVFNECQAIRDVLKSVDTQYREYEKAYREKIIEMHEKVELLGAGLTNRMLRKYSISSAYVELECVDENYEEEIKLSEVFSRKKIVWIKGEAGSGKTTFLKWVAICSAGNEYNKIKNIRNTIPVVISLRNAEWPLDLQSTVKKFSESLGYACPDGWLDKALTEHRIIVLIDGVDEVKESKRDEVYEFIDNLANKYKKLKILVTARNSVEDTLQCDVLHCEIQPMKINNIRKFVEYWHKSVLRVDAIEEDDEIQKLKRNLMNKIIESPAIKSLAKNPLLCAMICALNYTNNQYLPENKMDLYSKCCEMLIDARDNQRQIKASEYEELIKLEYNKKRRVLENLAYWMLRNENIADNKNCVVDFIKNLLDDLNIFPVESKCSAEIVLEYFIQRSGIIREVEADSIDFVHKTFMEFLAAKEICRKCDLDSLIKEACNVNWKETIIMCFYDLDEKYVADVLERMVKKGQEEKDERYILMASLGAANTMFKNLEIKDQINFQIKKLIPPKRKNISVLARAGAYLLPFLFDNKEFTDSEKLRCLELLSYLEQELPILNLLSYLSGNGSNAVKMNAADLLAMYSDEILDEYNVRPQLVDIMFNSIENDTLSISEGVINIIGDYTFSKREIMMAKTVKKLNVFCGVCDDSFYLHEKETFRYFRNVEELVLEGDITDLGIIQFMPNITQLTICSTTDMSDIIEILPRMTVLKNVKKFILSVEQLNYFCEGDLRAMESLEYLEFYCHDRNLEFALEDTKNMPNLKGVFIDVHEDVLQDMKMRNTFAKLKNSGIEIL